MVNFNDSNILSIPISNISKILIMEKKENVILALEKRYELGQVTSTIKNLIRARVITLFYQVKILLKTYNPKEYLIVEALSFSENQEELIKAFEIMDLCIYNLGIIDSNQEVLL